MARFKISGVLIGVLVILTAGAAGAGVADVDCDSGDSLNDAIAGAAGPIVDLTFEGFCDEKVVIARDNVTLTGIGDARIRAGGLDGALEVLNVSNISLNDFSVRGGAIYGLRISHSNNVAATNVDMIGNERWGGIIGSSEATIKNCSVEDNGTGTSALGGGINTTDARVIIQTCIISDNPAGGAAAGNRRVGVQSINASRTIVRFGNVVGVAAPLTAPEAEGTWAFLANDGGILWVDRARFSGNTYADGESRVEFTAATDDSGSSFSISGSASMRATDTVFASGDLNEFSNGYFTDSTPGSGGVTCNSGSEALCNDADCCF